MPNQTFYAMKAQTIVLTVMIFLLGFITRDQEGSPGTALLQKKKACRYSTEQCEATERLTRRGVELLYFEEELTKTLKAHTAQLLTL